MSWSIESEAELRRLAMDGRFSRQIAEKLGRKVCTVRWKAHKMGLNVAKEPVGQWNITHKHLREPVMRYFVTHTREQTEKKFKLTRSELRSIFTVGYRDPQMKHLRKETRRHDAWSTRELKFLLTHAGLQPRDWIGRKLKRGTPVCIKERLEKLGVSSRTLNGITLSQYIAAFGERPEFVLYTKAGPGRGGTPTYFQIVPWVWLDQQIKSRRLKAPKVFRQLTSTMALFQEWIHEGNALEKMKRISRKRS